MVRAGPADRRHFLDETLAVVDPKAARAADETEKVLKQRAALLRNVGRSLNPEAATTLDVWDARLEESGTRLVEARENLVAELAPRAAEHYARLAGAPTDVGLAYVRSWDGPLLEALGAARAKDVQRGVSTVGPHRDELELTLAGLPSRTQASQGEQRSLALALQLAAHQLATERLGTAPVLLLDDVFSELDPQRSRALLGRPSPRTGPAHHRPARAARGGGGQGLRNGRRGPRGGGGRDGVSPEPPHRRNSEPRPLDGSLDALSKRFGLQGAQGLGRLFAGWTDIVGAAMAEHVQPVRIDASALVVTVDHPAWATQVRRLGDTLLDRAADRAGVERPERLEVRVRR